MDSSSWGPKETSPNHPAGPHLTIAVALITATGTANGIHLIDEEDASLLGPPTHSKKTAIGSGKLNTVGTSRRTHWEPIPNALYKQCIIWEADKP